MDGRKDIRAWLAERKNALMNKNSKRDYEEKIYSESKRQKTEDQENEEYEIVCTDEPVESYETIQINYSEAEASRNREFEKFRSLGKPIIPASDIPRNLFRPKKFPDRAAPIPHNEPIPSIPDFPSSSNLETDVNPTLQIENFPQKRLIDKRNLKSFNVSGLMDSLRDIKIEPSAADENSLALENSAAEKNSVFENSATDGSSQFTSILDSFDSDSTDSESENTDNSVNPLESESSHEERLNFNTEGLQSAQTINAVMVKPEPAGESRAQDDVTDEDDVIDWTDFVDQSEMTQADLAEEKELVDYLEATKISDESTSNSTESGGNLENSECLKDREVYEYGSFHAQWAVNDIDRPDELDFKIKKENSRAEERLDEMQCNCICGKRVKNSGWCCDKGFDCKGSVWYHYKCGNVKKTRLTVTKWKKMMKYPKNPRSNNLAKFLERKQPFYCEACTESYRDDVEKSLKNWMPHALRFIEKCNISLDKEEKKKLKEKEQKASAPQVTIAECPICERKFGFCEEKLKSFENMGTFKLLKHYENNHDVSESDLVYVYECTVVNKFSGGKHTVCNFMTHSKRLLKAHSREHAYHKHPAPDMYRKSKIIDYMKKYLKEGEIMQIGKKEFKLEGSKIKKNI